MQHGQCNQCEKAGTRTGQIGNQEESHILEKEPSGVWKEGAETGEHLDRHTISNLYKAP